MLLKLYVYEYYRNRIFKRFVYIFKYSDSYFNSYIIQPFDFYKKNRNSEIRNIDTPQNIKEHDQKERGKIVLIFFALNYIRYS